MEGRHWLIGTVVVVILIVLGVAVSNMMSPSSSAPVSGQGGGQGVSALPTPGAVVISIASSNTKEDWLHAAAAKFNEASKNVKDFQVEGRPVFVEILQETVGGKKKDYRSGALVDDIMKGKIKPTIASPGEEVWIQRLKKKWQDQNNYILIRGDAPVVVRTPLVVATWQSYAQALGCWPAPGPNCTWQKIKELATHPEGWKMFGHPEWGKFKFGYGYYDKSNSGTLGIVTMCMVGAKKTKGLTLGDVSVDGGCGKFIGGVEMSKVHSGVSDVWLLDRMVERGPEYLHAVVTYESNVVLYNRKHANQLRQPLVSIYPQDGTVVVGHPYAILDNAPWITPEQVQAAKVFKNYLLAAEQQEAVLALGLRPADTNVKLGSPIEPAYGANPTARLVNVELPDLLTLERIGEVWHATKKRAAVVILLDKSGSMRHDNKMGAAIKGAVAFVESMEPNDILIYVPFDGTVYVGARGTKAQVGERLRGDITSTNADGGTALYDAMMTALDILEELRGKHGDTLRYGMVLLSDGDDQNSRKAKLSDVKARLKPQEDNPYGFQIHPNCIGSDCREDVMKEIAAAAHGKYSKGNTEQDMIRIYKDIAAHY